MISRNLKWVKNYIVLWCAVILQYCCTWFSSKTAAIFLWYSHCHQITVHDIIFLHWLQFKYFTAVSVNTSIKVLQCAQIWILLWTGLDLYPVRCSTEWIRYFFEHNATQFNLTYYIAMQHWQRVSHNQQSITTGFQSCRR